MKYLSAVPLTNGLGEAGAFDYSHWPRYVRTTDIAGPRSLRDDVFASLPPDVASRAKLAHGDILMTAAGATIGKSVQFLEDFDACYAGFLVRFRAAQGVDSRFIGYWMRSAGYWGQIVAGAVRSTIDNFSASKYQNLRLAVPTLSEQVAIADRLDQDDEVVERALAATQSWLVLAEERKRAVITASVTGHWDVTTARRVA